MTRKTIPWLEPYHGVIPLHVLLNGGEYCGNCDRNAIARRESINSKGMIMALIWLVHESPKHPGGWVQTREEAERQDKTWMLRNNQTTKMKYFGLLIPQVGGGGHGSKTDPKKTAFWRPTSLGFQFAADLVSIPRYCWVYDDRVVKVGGAQITISHIAEHGKGRFKLREYLIEAGYIT